MPTGDEDVPELADPKGQIPVERVKAILTNARQKEAARITTELVEKTYGIDPDTYRSLEIGAHVQQFLANPVKYWHDLGKTIEQAGTKLEWGSAPSAARPAAPAAPANGAPAAPTAMPQPDMVTSDGIPAYSAEKMLEVVQYQLAQFEQRLNGRLEPVEGLVTQEKQREIERAATDWAKDKLKEAESWEGWNDLKKDVHALMLRDARYTVEGAYVKLFKEKYMPGLKARHRQETIDELNKAPKANTITPTNPTPAARGRKGRGAPDWDAAITDAIDKVTAHSS